MSVVSILNIQVLDNPTRYSNPFQFEITFECVSQLKNGTMSAKPTHISFLVDLEWKIVYVGSAEDDRYDQTLDQIMVGPVPVGINRFVFQADAPDPRKIPPQDVLGVTVVLIICSYMEQEFVRIGYYVNNEYDDEVLKETPPEEIAYDRIVRNVLSDKPRVTRIPIKWDSTDEIGPPPEGTDGVEEEMEMDGFDLPSHQTSIQQSSNRPMELEVD